MDRRFSVKMCSAIRAVAGNQKGAWLHGRTLVGLTKRELLTEGGEFTSQGRAISRFLGAVKGGSRSVTCSECGKRHSGYLIAWGASSEERPVCITCVVKGSDERELVE